MAEAPQITTGKVDRGSVGWHTALFWCARPVTRGDARGSTGPIAHLKADTGPDPARVPRPILDSEHPSGTGCTRRSRRAAASRGGCARRARRAGGGSVGAPTIDWPGSPRLSPTPPTPSVTAALGCRPGRSRTSPVPSRPGNPVGPIVGPISCTPGRWPSRIGTY